MCVCSRPRAGARSTMDLTKLTRRHGIKIAPAFPCSVEECSLAVGGLVGHSSVKSAARMNNAVVIFLDSVEKASLFLMKDKIVSPSLPGFYKSVFKVWNLLKKEPRQQGDSLHWLLQEPVLYGTFLDHPPWAQVTLSRVVQVAGVATLGQVVELSGPGLEDPAGLAEKLRIKSKRTMERVLDHWRGRIREQDIFLLNQFKDGSISPNVEDPFPAIFLALEDRGVSGPLVQPARPVSLVGASGKILYGTMVKTLNVKKLEGRTDTPWRSFFGGGQKTGPQWRSLYKPPLSKRHGDLQWRVLHGIMAVNAFVSILRTTVEDKCPFCNIKETIFHCFYECHRLSDLFLFLQVVFTSFKEVFNKQVFIYGFKYTRQKKTKKPAFKLCFRAG